MYLRQRAPNCGGVISPLRNGDLIDGIVLESLGNRLVGSVRCLVRATDSLEEGAQVLANALDVRGCLGRACGPGLLEIGSGALLDLLYQLDFGPETKDLRTKILKGPRRLRRGIQSLRGRRIG